MRKALGGLDLRIDFLHKAIADCQGNIRALDTKLQVMLTVLLLPLTLLGKVSSIRFPMSRSWHTFHLVDCLTVVMLAIWVAALLCVFKGLSAISNPSELIEKCQSPGDLAPGQDDSFYLPGVSKLSIRNLLSNRLTRKSGVTLLTVVSALPREQNDVVRVLAFEQMKLSVIRNFKIYRQKGALVLLILWALTSSLVWVFQSQTNASSEHCQCPTAIDS